MLHILILWLTRHRWKPDRLRYEPWPQRKREPRFTQSARIQYQNALPSTTYWPAARKEEPCWPYRSPHTRD